MTKGGKKGSGNGPPGDGGTGQGASGGGNGSRDQLSDSDQSRTSTHTFTADDLSAAFSQMRNPSAPPLEGNSAVGRLVGELAGFRAQIEAANAARDAAAAEAAAAAARAAELTAAGGPSAPNAGEEQEEPGTIHAGALLVPMRPRAGASDEEVTRWFKLKYQMGSKNDFKVLLRHYFPLDDEYEAKYKEITGEDKRVPLARRPPAGGYGSLFHPQNEHDRVLNPSSRFSLERAVQDGFVNTRTGAPVGDLRYLEKQLKDQISSEVPLNPEDYGVSYMFTMLRDIWDPNKDVSPEERMRNMQKAFSEKRMEQMIKGVNRAQSEEWESNHNTADTVPCPLLKPNTDKSGEIDGNTLKTLEAIYSRSKFSGDVGKDDIAPEVYFRKMHNFLNGKFNSNAAYLIMSVSTTGRAANHIARCEGINIGFQHCWDSMAKLFLGSSDPDAAERIIIDMRSHRPRNVSKYLCKLWRHCKEAAYAKPPEMRPSAEINRFRDEAERMIKKYYPFVHKSINLRDKRMSVPWQTERTRLIEQGKCPDTYSTVPYHPLASYLIYAVEEIGDLAANNPKRESDDKPDRKAKRAKKGAASVAGIGLDDPPSAPQSLGGSQSVLGAAQQLLQAESSSDDAMYSRSEADSDSDDDNSVGSDYVDLAALGAAAKKPNFQHLPTGAEPRRDDRKDKKNKVKGRGGPRVCLLCGGPHEYEFCPTYKDASGVALTPVTTRCTNPKCQLFHPGPCKYDEAQRAIAERAAKKKEREAANNK